MLDEYITSPREADDGAVADLKALDPNFEYVYPNDLTGRWALYHRGELLQTLNGPDGVSYVEPGYCTLWVATEHLGHIREGERRLQESIQRREQAKQKDRDSAWDEVAYVANDQAKGVMKKFEAALPTKNWTREDEREVERNNPDIARALDEMRW